MISFVQVWIATVAVSFCWAAIGVIQAEVANWEHSVDHNEAAALRWTGSFRAYLEEDGGRAILSLPPRSDHQRGSDPLVCEMARDLGIEATNPTWSCP